MRFKKRECTGDISILAVLKELHACIYYKFSANRISFLWAFSRQLVSIEIRDKLESRFHEILRFINQCSDSTAIFVVMHVY